MRKYIDLNDNWLFCKTCQSVPVSMPCENGWEKVSIPHTWNAVDGQDGSPFERGAYWYVTSFEKPEQPLSGGRIYLEVGAAAIVAQVWVNGTLMTTHTGGFSAFRVDITDVCSKGLNTLAIMCDNRYSDKYYPQRADFTFYGGLYRYVRLISVPAARFTLDDLGGSGVYVDTEVENSKAKVRVRAKLDNVGKDNTVGLEIIDEKGDTVVESWTFAQEQTEFNTVIYEPKLWNGPGDANMYTARLKLVSFNEVLDQVEVRFGVRYFEIDKDNGFYLNGKQHPLHGVCRHQDRLYMGNAISKKEHYEDAGIIADMGANCIRLAHYQQSQDMYDACDELGLVVWAEIPYFAVSWDDDAHKAAVNEMKELVIQNYNHPSICFWGLSNEILMAGNDNEKLMDCHWDLENAVKSIDTTRLTVIAHEYAAGWDHPLHGVSDVEGWNHYYGWYRGEMSDLGTWLDEYHSAYPDRLISVSEYGCEAVIGYHSDDPVKMDYTEEYQAIMHEHACKVFSERPWVWGTFVWNMFDFGSHFRREGGTKGRNNKGLVTLDRKIKKDSYYVHKTWRSKEPFVHIAGRRFFARPGDTACIKVYSNLSHVELKVDGKPFASQDGEHVFEFKNVPLSKAGVTIEAEAGGLLDAVTLYSTDEMPAQFTNPEFKYSQDAVNWFESVEEVVGALEAIPGYYSIFDKMGDIIKNPVTKKAFKDIIGNRTRLGCLRAAHTVFGLAAA